MSDQKYYRTLLEHSFEVEKKHGESAPESRLEYLSESIFNFTIYDSEMSELFATKAVEVCAAINEKTVYDYIADHKNYTWFLLMCNMPFFADRLEWGVSIRGAWWGVGHGQQLEFSSCGLWIGDKQCLETLKFSDEEWGNFIAAVIEFANVGAE